MLEPSVDMFPTRSMDKYGKHRLTADDPWCKKGLTLEERHKAFHDDLRPPQNVIRSVAEPDGRELLKLIREGAPRIQRKAKRGAYMSVIQEDSYE